MGIGLILDSFLKALGQIGNARFTKVLLLGVGLTLALLIGAAMGLYWFVNWVVGDDARIFGFTVNWLDTLLGWSSVLAVMVLSVFLMVPVASAMTSLFLDEVAQAVEDKHYPHLPPASPLSLADGIADTLSFLGIMIAANLAALVLYLVFMPLAPLIFWGLNGFLLGREYFTLAASRRIGRTGARALRAQHAGTIWLAGVFMAIPLSVPLLNLLVPILGAATFTHVFHGLQRKAA